MSNLYGHLIDIYIRGFAIVFIGVGLDKKLELLEGDEELIKYIYTIISDLVFNLKNLPESSFGKGALPMFRNCVIKLNCFEMEIETVERESILDVLYQLGELVGLPRSSEFLEKWRGDW